MSEHAATEHILAKALDELLAGEDRVIVILVVFGLVGLVRPRFVVGNPASPPTVSEFLVGAQMEPFIRRRRAGRAVDLRVLDCREEGRTQPAD